MEHLEVMVIVPKELFQDQTFLLFNIANNEETSLFLKAINTGWQTFPEQGGGGSGYIGSFLHVNLGVKKALWSSFKIVVKINWNSFYT